ncbi:unnamed protein product [Cunninghamella echinulata]
MSPKSTRGRGRGRGRGRPPKRPQPNNNNMPFDSSSTASISTPVHNYTSTLDVETLTISSSTIVPTPATTTNITRLKDFSFNPFSSSSSTNTNNTNNNDDNDNKNNTDNTDNNELISSKASVDKFNLLQQDTSSSLCTNIFSTNNNNNNINNDKPSLSISNNSSFISNTSFIDLETTSNFSNIETNEDTSTTFSTPLSPTAVHSYIDELNFPLDSVIKDTTNTSPTSQDDDNNAGTLKLSDQPKSPFVPTGINVAVVEKEEEVEEVEEVEVEEKEEEEEEEEEKIVEKEKLVDQEDVVIVENEHIVEKKQEVEHIEEQEVKNNDDQQIISNKLATTATLTIANMNNNNKDNAHTQHNETPTFIFNYVNLHTLPKPNFIKLTDIAPLADKTQSTNNEDKKTRSSRNGKVTVSSTKSNENGKDVKSSITVNGVDENNNEENIDHSVVVFNRPENHYIRYIEPTEEELFEMVEYDMDEQDEAWLEMFNAIRKKEKLGEVSPALFENIMDKLEKEWFDLIKHLPKQISDQSSLPEDSTCAICDDGECDNSNAIVFCDGCNLAVHQECYGIPYIPEGQWLCRKCMVTPDKPVSCIFCPNEGGAFKQTSTNKWGHLLCGLWIPEADLGNSVYMEPIDNIDKIPKSRWKLTCYICRKKNGACIQCDNKHCCTAFHVTCARWARLCMRMKTQHDNSVVLKAYCDKHTPREYREEVDVEKCVLAAQEVLDPKSPRNKGRPKSSCTPRMRHIDEFLEEEAKELELENEIDGDSDDSVFEGSSDYDEEDEEDEDEEIYNEHDEEDEYSDDSQSFKLQRNKNKRKRSSYGKKQVNSSRQKRQKRQKKQKRKASAITKFNPNLKAARAHQHHYTAGAPIAPDYILNKLENLKCVRQASHLKKKPELITSISRYWSIKRESRRGAPLLKRLHLEPWTASSSLMKQSEVEQAHKASAMMNLRTDLERVRLLSEQVQKREKQKLERLKRQREYIEMVLYPIEYIVKPILNQLMELDKKELFLHPVTVEMAPDYHDIIKQPMCFTDIIEKFHSHEYTTIDEVEADLQLIWSNSKTYNRSETAYYKLAQRMEEESKELMKRAREEYNTLEVSAQSGTLLNGIDPEIFEYKLSTETKPLKNEVIVKSEENIKIGDKVNQLEEKQLEDIKANESETEQQDKREKNTQLLPSTVSKRSTRSNPQSMEYTQLERNPRKSRRFNTRSLSSNSNISLSSSSSSSLSSPPSSSSSPSLNLAGSSISPLLSTALSPTTSTDDESLNIETSIPSPSSSPEECKVEQPRESLRKRSRSNGSAQQEQPITKQVKSQKDTSPLSTSTKSIRGTSSRRRTRSSGTEGLVIPTVKNIKPSAINNEMKKLLTNNWEIKPIAYEEGSYKASKTKQAKKGYVYVSSSSSSDNDDNEEEEEEEEEEEDDDDDDSTTNENNPNSKSIQLTSNSSSKNQKRTTRSTFSKSINSENNNSNTNANTNDSIKIEKEGEEEDTILKKFQQTNVNNNASSSSSSKKKSSKKATSKNTLKKPTLTKTFKPIKEELHTIEPGSIVWARVPGFPAHPAKIVDTDSIKITKTILQNRTPLKPVLVEFYEVPENHRWGWINEEDSFLVGDEPTDLLVINTVKKFYKHKYSEVLRGYKRVCTILNISAQVE